VRIVYNSFHGRYSDNPRALFERLHDSPGIEHVWLADPTHADRFPPFVSTVPIDSRDAGEALHDADLVVANTHTEVEWARSPGTTYLQTWHGTPLKRIHRDVLWAPPGRLDRLDEDVARWDLLLSPNSASTPRLRAAFGFDGPIAETGYPRNDLLVGSAGDPVREVVRKELGIGDHVTAVLYAPTWRDNERFTDGDRSDRPVPLGLDLAALAGRLGDDHCVVARLHNMMTGRSRPPADPRVLDASLYPDVRDLYLAADVLVTDYSSAMFDFAVTGKPVYYYAYDLERFRDEIRGFYFDLAPESPGPIIDDEAELAAAILDRTAVQDAYAARYRRFQETYCYLEDGGATDRVLELLGLASST
jgi:CDP-glycerol glycerophosphotransferase